MTVRNLMLYNAEPSDNAAILSQSGEPQAKLFTQPKQIERVSL